MADEFIYPKYLLVNGAGRDLLLTQRFTEPERLCWFVGVLSIASGSPIRGWLFIAPNEPALAADIAAEAGVSVQTARTALEKLKRYEMVEYDETVCCDFVPNFDEHNPAPKKDPTNAVRQQRYRDRQKVLLGNAAVTGSNALRNGAVVTPVTGTSRSRSRSRSEEPNGSSRPEIVRLCSLLADLVEQNGSKRPAVTAKWHAACRLLLDRDGRTEAQVESAIRWCQADEFWRANVLSMPKLREQYDQLRLQAQRTAGPKGGVTRNAEGLSMHPADVRDRELAALAERLQAEEAA